MKNIEIEAKFKVENTAPLLRLLKKEAKFLGEERQVDEYFNAPHRDFLAQAPKKGDTGPSKILEWLRLRTEKGKSSINYKFWHKDAKDIAHHCDEFETMVADAAQLRKILAALNFVPMITVDKQRKTWKYKSYEVAIDKVKQLGTFVELEFKAKSTKKTPEEVTTEMETFIRSLGCGEVKRDHRGYPFHLLFPQK